MLSPEVWNFKPPQYLFEHHEQLRQGDTKEADNDQPTNTIKAHYFNHSVSVVLPNISSIPENFNESILEDSAYYRVNGLHVVELINKEFIESFIKKGELSLITIEKRIDVDNLVGIAPTGHLLLSLVRDSYQKLGIEGKSTFFERKEHSRYVVTIDLKDDNISPGKKYYERIYNSLDKLLDLKLDIIVSWDPPEEKLCPSSVAAWFNKRGYLVSICHQQMIQRVEYSLDIPLLEDKCDRDKFFEWLGLFSIRGNLVNDNEESLYVNSYACPDPKTKIGQVQYLQFTGFFTREKIGNIYNMLKNYAVMKNLTLPWCSMDVQGFADSPVSWGLKEHNFYTDGDNSFTIVLRSNNDGYILRKSLSSNNKPKIK